MPKAAVIIPAYNEEKNIVSVVKQAKKSSPNSLIMVVDDGSKDNTYRFAKEAGAVVIRNSKNIGKVGSTQKAFEYIKRNYPDVKFIVLIDADNQYSALDIPKFLKYADKKVDFVIGKRSFEDIPYFRHFFGIRVGAAFFNFLYGTNFKDTVCGFRAISTDAFEKMDLKSSGYAVESEMLVEALKKGMEIKEVPVRVRYKISHTARKWSTMLINITLHLILWKMFDRRVVEKKILKLMKLYKKLF